MAFLPLGSIVELKGAENHHKAMVTARLPLMEKDGEKGYFDYAGCAYPEGQITVDSFFFNEEDIVEVFSKGKILPEEEEYQKILNEALENVSYPKFYN